MSERLVQFHRQFPRQTGQPHNGKTPELVTVPQDATLKEKIIAALRNIYDPEIPVNIYELGLIYDINVADPANVKVEMTLTSPHCPVAESLPAQVECSIKALDEVENVCVNLVWNPPWSQDRMSEEARLILNMY